MPEENNISFSAIAGRYGRVAAVLSVGIVVALINAVGFTGGFSRTTRDFFEFSGWHIAHGDLVVVHWLWFALIVAGFVALYYISAMRLATKFRKAQLVEEALQLEAKPSDEAKKIPAPSDKTDVSFNKELTVNTNPESGDSIKLTSEHYARHSAQNKLLESIKTRMKFEHLKIQFSSEDSGSEKVNSGRETVNTVASAGGVITVSEKELQEALDVLDCDIKAWNVIKEKPSTTDGAEAGESVLERDVALDRAEGRDETSPLLTAGSDLPPASSQKKSTPSMAKQAYQGLKSHTLNVTVMLLVTLAIFVPAYLGIDLGMNPFALLMVVLASYFVVRAVGLLMLTQYDKKLEPFSRLDDDKVILHLKFENWLSGTLRQKADQKRDFFRGLVSTGKTFSFENLSDLKDRGEIQELKRYFPDVNDKPDANDKDTNRVTIIVRAFLSALCFVKPDLNFAVLPDNGGKSSEQPHGQAETSGSQNTGQEAATPPRMIGEGDRSRSGSPETFHHGKNNTVKREELLKDLNRGLSEFEDLGGDQELAVLAAWDEMMAYKNHYLEVVSRQKGLHGHHRRHPVLRFAYYLGEFIFYINPLVNALTVVGGSHDLVYAVFPNIYATLILCAVAAIVASASVTILSFREVWQNFLDRIHLHTVSFDKKGGLKRRGIGAALGVMLYGYGRVRLARKVFFWATALGMTLGTSFLAYSLCNVHLPASSIVADHTMAYFCAGITFFAAGALYLSKALGFLDHKGHRLCRYFSQNFIPATLVLLTVLAISSNNADKLLNTLAGDFHMGMTPAVTLSIVVLALAAFYLLFSFSGIYDDACDAVQDLSGALAKTPEQWLDQVTSLEKLEKPVKIRTSSYETTPFKDLNFFGGAELSTPSAEYHGQQNVGGNAGHNDGGVQLHVASSGRK